MPAIPNTFVANTVADPTEVNDNFTAVANAIRPTFVFTIIGTLTTGTDLVPTLIVPSSLTINKVYGAVKTAPSGDDILIDVNLNATSIWDSNQNNRLTIADGATTGNQTSFDTTALSEGDLLTMDVDQIGSSTAGADLTVEVKCE